MLQMRIRKIILASIEGSMIQKSNYYKALQIAAYMTPKRKQIEFYN